MVILDESTAEGFAKITKDTKTVFAAVFGFYSHDRVNDLQNFFKKDLGLKLAEADKTLSPGTLAIEVYNVCGRRTADLAHVLCIPFKSKAEAARFITEKIAKSDFVNKSLFDEVAFIDANVFWSEMTECTVQTQEIEKAEKTATDEIVKFMNAMEAKYASEPAVVEQLKNKILS
jgi:hypothetical protein